MSGGVWGWKCSVVPLLSIRPRRTHHWVALESSGMSSQRQRRHVYPKDESNMQSNNSGRVDGGALGIIGKEEGQQERVTKDVAASATNGATVPNGGVERVSFSAYQKRGSFGGKGSTRQRDLHSLPNIQFGTVPQDLDSSTLGAIDSNNHGEVSMPSRISQGVSSAPKSINYGENYLSPAVISGQGRIPSSAPDLSPTEDSVKQQQAIAGQSRDLSASKSLGGQASVEEHARFLDFAQKCSSGGGYLGTYGGVFEAGDFPELSASSTTRGRGKPKARRSQKLASHDSTDADMDGSKPQEPSILSADKIRDSTDADPDLSKSQEPSILSAGLRRREQPDKFRSGSGSRETEGQSSSNRRRAQEYSDAQHGGRRRDAAKTENVIANLGRTLTKILRHDAVGLKLQMRNDGYVDIEDVLKLPVKTWSDRPLSSHSKADVLQAVSQDTKQRLGVKEENGLSLIRARQGHTIKSVESEHLLKPIHSADEVPVCVHGTYMKYMNLIFKEGLKRMTRNHIHFATGNFSEKDVISGMRSTSQVLIYLNVEKALADGMKLYISENGVILTEGFGGVVPPDYFARVIEVHGGQPLSLPSEPS